MISAPTIIPAQRLALPRRRILASLAALFVAPAIVPASSLMRMVPIRPADPIPVMLKFLVTYDEKNDSTNFSMVSDSGRLLGAGSIPGLWNGSISTLT